MNVSSEFYISEQLQEKEFHMVLDDPKREAIIHLKKNKNSFITKG
jgi:hypothetical protein